MVAGKSFKEEHPLGEWVADRRTSNYMIMVVHASCLIACDWVVVCFNCCILWCACYPLIDSSIIIHIIIRDPQKKGHQKPNASDLNTQIEYLWSAKKPTDLTSRTSTRRSTLCLPIWLWVNFIMWFASAFSLPRRRPCSFFVQILSLRMVSVLPCNKLMSHLFTRFIDNTVWTATITPIAALMSTVYEEQKDEDGFLYVQYSGESTFGWISCD